MKNLFYCLMALISVLGCSVAKEKKSLDSSSQVFSFSAERAIMEKTFVINAPDASSIHSASWRVVTVDDDVDVTEQCTPINGGKSLSCVFETDRAVTVELTATTLSGGSFTLKQVVDVLDPSYMADQAPVIVLRVTNTQSGVEAAVVSNDFKLRSGSTNFIEGTYSLNFGDSKDEDVTDGNPATNVSFAMKIGNADFATPPATIAFAVGAAVPITIQASDSKGNVSEISFIVYPSCAGPNNLAISGVTATHVSGNIFKYAANVTGAPDGAKIYLMWDYNGDTVYDKDWMLNSLENSQYTEFAGPRLIRVKAWESTCNYQKEFLTTINFPTPRLNHDGNLNTPEQVLEFGNGSNYFVQADLTDLIGENSKYNGQYIVTKRPGQVPNDVVKCAHSTGSTSVTITGLMHYDTATKPGYHKHGFSLEIGGLSASTGLQPDAKLKNVYYSTDFEEDAFNAKYLFQQNDCQLSLIKQQAIALTPCGPTDLTESKKTTTTIFYGKFICNKLAVNSTVTVDANNGAFYCEVQSVDQCVGGGGGGGGGVPPKEY
jgi:hypothetical protein